MAFASVPVSRILSVCGIAYVLAILLLIVSKAPLGSGIFVMAAAIATAAYAAILIRVWDEPVAQRRLLRTAFLFALAFRIPPALAPVGVDSDMVRYLWDGRVQRLGYNPYRVLPSDLALAHTHRNGSQAMPSRNDRTPYPPAAQFFFRLVVSISDSTLAMKLALLLCDLLTALVLWRWLVHMQQSEWLVLTYAWNPLVVLEVAHSGHVDALGTLWIAAAAFWLTRRRTLLATLAFVLAVATKFLPIVLLPLFAGRIRRQDAVAGVLLLGALYVPYSSGSDIPLGAVPNVIEFVRFNDPVFKLVRAFTFPKFAAAFALAVGLSAAVWARWKLSERDPAAWAWPMGLTIACAPVIYPWYVLYLTPFLFSAATIPLMVWTISILGVYEVWRRSRLGARWVTPWWVMALEFGAVIAATFIRLSRARPRATTPDRHVPS
jgi:alpha-1,6-mannosyltransferase